MSIFDVLFGWEDGEEGPLYCPVCDNILHACTCHEKDDNDE